MASKKSIYFPGLSCLRKGLHTSTRTSGQPRSPDNDHKRIWRIPQGSEPVGRDPCALRALAALPSLWPRSPAPRSPASQPTGAPAARRVPTPRPPRRPSRRPRNPARGPSPAPHPGRPPPARPPRPARGTSAPARPGPRPVQAAGARGPVRRAQACRGLPHRAPPRAPASPGRGRAGPGLLRGGRAGGGGGSALTAPLGLGSGGGGGGRRRRRRAAPSARTTRSGPRPGHAPRRARPLAGARHGALLIGWRGCRGTPGRAAEAGLPAGAAAEGSAAGGDAGVAGDGRGGGRRGPGPRRPAEGGGRRAASLVERMPCVPRPSVSPPPPSPPCKKTSLIFIASVRGKMRFKLQKFTNGHMVYKASPAPSSAAEMPREGSYGLCRIHEEGTRDRTLRKGSCLRGPANSWRQQETRL
nr:translation initiation factor IF-2-like [Equus asinus]